MRRKHGRAGARMAGMRRARNILSHRAWRRPARAGRGAGRRGRCSGRETSYLSFGYDLLNEKDDRARVVEGGLHDLVSTIQPAMHHLWQLVQRAAPGQETARDLLACVLGGAHEAGAEGKHQEICQEREVQGIQEEIQREDDETPAKASPRASLNRIASSVFTDDNS